MYSIDSLTHYQISLRLLSDLLYRLNCHIDKQSAVGQTRMDTLLFPVTKIIDLGRTGGGGYNYFYA